MSNFSPADLSGNPFYERVKDYLVYEPDHHFDSQWLSFGLRDGFQVRIRISGHKRSLWRIINQLSFFVDWDQVHVYVIDPTNTNDYDYTRLGAEVKGAVLPYDIAEMKVFKIEEIGDL